MEYKIIRTEDISMHIRRLLVHVHIPQIPPKDELVQLVKNIAAAVSTKDVFRSDVFRDKFFEKPVGAIWIYFHKNSVEESEIILRAQWVHRNVALYRPKWITGTMLDDEICVSDKV